MSGEIAARELTDERDAASAEEGPAARELARAEGESDDDAPEHVSGDGEQLGRADGAAPARGVGHAHDAADEFTAFLRNHVGSSAEASDKITNLRASQKQLSAEKKRVSMDIRNERRKRTRRLANSAKLTTMDLVAVLEDRKLRSDAKAKAAAKPKARPRVQ